ncbi:MAG: peptidoglycan editing factor PgeF [Sulfuricellaceae bacterium]
MNPDYFIVPDWPAPAHVRALCTTRCGGVSTGAYAGLNLGDHVGDDPLAVARNRALLREHLPTEPLWLNQVHGINVAAADCACGAPQADAGVARRAQAICAVLTADCLPVLLCDKEGTVVGAAHAGWRGLAAGVIESAIVSMDADPATLLAWLGPAIGPGAFEVGDEVRAVFLAHDKATANAFAPHAPGKWLADIYHLARLRLARSGVTQVYGGDFCTFRERERFYSYRRDRTTGRMASLIWLD